MSQATSPSVRQLLEPPQLSGPAGAALRSLSRQALITLLLLLVLAASWSALAPMAGAVVSPGVVRTEHNRKVIQHQEGGLVQRILVLTDRPACVQVHGLGRGPIAAQRFHGQLDTRPATAAEVADRIAALRSA